MSARCQRGQGLRSRERCGGSIRGRHEHSQGMVGRASAFALAAAARRSPAVLTKWLRAVAASCSCERSHSSPCAAHTPSTARAPAFERHSLPVPRGRPVWARAPSTSNSVLESRHTSHLTRPCGKCLDACAQPVLQPARWRPYAHSLVPRGCASHPLAHSTAMRGRRHRSHPPSASCRQPPAASPLASARWTPTATQPRV